MIDLNNITLLGKNCCGCAGCEQACPQGCISFSPDSEGFLYPEVDESRCTGCSVCLKKCPVYSEIKRGGEPKVFAAKIKDKKTALNSTSGGVFTAIAKHVLKSGGIVYGCAYDENLAVRHISVESESELYKLQSSKYVQSNTRGIYFQAKKRLNDGKLVLFSGTGCQVAGLKAFLGRDYDNLILTDIVCHGVPSPLLFEKYLEYMGGKMGGKIKAYNFRSKEKYGWDKYFKIETASKSKQIYGYFDPYYNAFMNGNTFRESCYECKFANSRRAGDITLGDFWGVRKYHPDIYDFNGVSLVLINTEKGEKLWQLLNDNIESVPSLLENAVPLNKNLCAPPKRPSCRDGIYDGIDKDLNTYFNNKLAYKVDPKTKIKTMIPVGLKNALKKLKS